MFLEMKDFDFYPNLIKFYQILPNLSKFYPIYLIFSNLPKLYPNWPKFCPNWHKFCPNLLEKFTRGCGRIPSSYSTVREGLKVDRWMQQT